ncbi:MAG: hypothetical protein ACOYVK_10205 [Bacillota bacterium]
MEIIRNLDIQVNKERVYRVMQLSKESAAYEETNGIYEALEKEMTRIVSPQIMLHLSDKISEKVTEAYDNSEKSLYVVLTLGRKAAELPVKYFNRGQYLESFLANTMADDMLFRLTEMSYGIIFDYAKRMHVGLAEKLSPGDNIPLEFQKDILEKADPQGCSGIGITEGYMLNPQKSSAFMFGANPGQPLHFDGKHLCCACQNKNCLWREA